MPRLGGIDVTILFCYTYARRLTSSQLTPFSFCRSSISKGHISRGELCRNGSSDLVRLRQRSPERMYVSRICCRRYCTEISKCIVFHEPSTGSKLSVMHSPISSGETGCSRRRSHTLASNMMQSSSKRRTSPDAFLLCCSVRL